MNQAEETIYNWNKKQRHNREYKRGFWKGFYTGIVAMGLFSIFVFIMTFILGGGT